jgi:hypothetical protein
MAEPATPFSENLPADFTDLAKHCGGLPLPRLVEALREDQVHRWRAGQRVLAEAYLKAFPAVAASSEDALVLIWGEVLLRHEQGEAPQPAEYQARFPPHAGALAAQFELERHLEQRPDTTLVSPGGPAADCPLPDKFGRYRILKRLGQGGMGTVYLAQDTQLGRPVALKIPHFDAEDDTGRIERFYREARVAATFTHPHLCPVYDVGEIDGVHFLTMPYLPGETLASWLKRHGPLAQAEAIRLAAFLARALDVAHRAGVVHRDLKPANVMLNEGREPVIMDFGLARRSAAGDPRLTVSGILVGTPGYLAPERVGGDAESPSPAGDIYSLGVMLYEMLTGRLPFEGPVHDLLRQVLTREPESPSGRRPGLDPRLEAVCLKALAKDPKQRFPDMASFAVALEACRREEGGQSTLEIQALASGRARRRRVILVGAAAVAVFLALLQGLTGNFLVGGSPSAYAVQPGSRWLGTYDFRSRVPRHGEVQLAITERTADQFRGRYTTEHGRYEWLIAGTVEQGKVRWEFRQVVRGDHESQALVGKGWVEGTVYGEAMTVVFHDPNDGSVADMRLRLEK